VGEAADEVSADEPFAELRPIYQRERIGKTRARRFGPSHFTVIAFSRHELSVVGRDERLHPEQIFYLHDLPGASLARELSRAGGFIDNLEFRIKHDATIGTRTIFCSCASLTPCAVTFTLKTVIYPILSGSAC
jgi:hypothetical protein